MFKVLKNIKESWISVIAIVLLLIVQAAGDLTLPDYTSKIVNVGIQNGGIENVAPEVIRKSEMENMLIYVYKCFLFDIYCLRYILKGIYKIYLN